MGCGDLRCVVCLLLLSLAALVGCDQAVPPAPPPPEVTVALPVVRRVVLYREFTGTTDAVESVEVMARVQGFLKTQHFKDGADVKAGELLFVIEPDQFEAQVAQRKAELEAAEADVKFAESELVRAEKLVKRGAITQAELEIKTANRDKAKASVELAKAALAESELNLSYTSVSAPISGRISRALPDVGSLVGPNENSLLTTIARLDPIHAYFNLTEVELLEATRRRKDQGNDADKPAEKIPAFLGTGDSTDYPFEGEIDFIDNHVDPNTGTIEVRGVFPNVEKMLVPGMFVRIRVPVRARDDAVMVEERALGTDLGGKYLLIVGPDNVVEHRAVRIGPKDDKYRAIDEGLKPDERYVVVGVLRARPGLAVTPKMLDASPADTGPASAVPENAGAAPSAPAN